MQKRLGGSQRRIALISVFLCLSCGAVYILAQTGIVVFPTVINYRSQCANEHKGKLLVDLWEPRPLTQSGSRPGRPALLCLDGSGEASYAFPIILQQASRFAISPDGTRVAFNDSAHGEHVVVANLDGTNAQQLFDRFGAEYSYAWSPDGQSLAFRAYDEKKSGLYSVSISCINAKVDCDTRVQYLGSGDDPIWSPDGSHIAFSDSDNGHPAIFVMNNDGKERKEVFSASQGGGRTPQWSPDGKSLLFFSTLPPEGLYLLNLETSALKVIMPDGDNACWVPGGKQIVYVSFKDNPSRTGYHLFDTLVAYNGLYLLDIDSGKELRLNQDDRQHIQLMGDCLSLYYP